MELLINLIMDGFVDDTMIWINRFEEQLSGHGGIPINVITDLLRNAAQWWEQLLFATGGKLELPKCFYQLQWKFNDEGVLALMTKVELNTNISIIDSDTKDIMNITQLDPDEAHKTLGAKVAPTGNMKEEQTRLV